jgi:hypothetical protein
MTRLTPTRVGVFNDQFWFQGTEPVITARYLVDGPASRHCRRDLSPERAEDHGHEDAGRRSSVRVERRARATRLFPNRGWRSRTVPALVVTTDPSWRSFSKWWAELSSRS